MSSLEPLGTAGGVPQKAPSPGSRLNRRQKAAIIVRLLIEDGAEISLASLPDHLQIALTEEIGAMGNIDRETLSIVAAEFAEHLDAIGLSFPGGLAEALSVLDGRISPAIARRLREDAGVRMAGDPWERISALDTEVLAAVLERESTEVGAVMLSKLSVGKAAELLQMLPGEKARRITYAISLTGNVTPDAVDRIGLSLASQLDAQPSRAFDEGPVERVGAILNSSAGTTREDVLAGLDEADAGFAEQVRQAIFTFVNIPARIAPRDIPKIIREVPQPDLVTALAAAAAEGEAAQEAAEFILTNMSQRMAAALREESAELDRVAASEGEAAMTRVVAAIRQLEDAGEITLVTPQEK